LPPRPYALPPYALMPTTSPSKPPPCRISVPHLRAALSDSLKVYEMQYAVHTRISLNTYAGKLVRTFLGARSVDLRIVLVLVLVLALLLRILVLVLRILVLMLAKGSP